MSRGPDSPGSTPEPGSSSSSAAGPRTARLARPAEVRFDPRDGLVTAVVQDLRDGRVLMVAHMDAEALEATLATGDVHFHSRSRDSLWRKGETSGNILRAVAIAADCDGDALLVTVEPTGPTCHRGTRSCFDPDEAGKDDGDEAGDDALRPATSKEQGFAWLETLWTTLARRATDRPAGSYTAGLLDGGVDVVARKVTEEAGEVLIAAKDDAFAETTGDDRDPTARALAGESADLLYHLLVLLVERGLPAATVLDVLRRRHQS
jgi:phosphoribosyl-ATP pyrophosphohydrolase/phosphoribosyl-AMP cyclohydrolase